MTTTINASTSSGLVNTADTSGILQLQTASTAALTIDASQNVGIGTATPTAKLTVNNATATDYLSLTTAGSTKGVLADEAGDLIIKSAASLLFQTNGAIRARLNTTGAFVLAGGTTTANGIGITFPATQSASSDANTLDDYEEGTWTPVVSAQTGSITSYTSSGSYTKIGNVVTLLGRITITNAGSAGGNLGFASMPFTSGGSDGNLQPAAPVRESGQTGVIYFAYTQQGGFTNGSIQSSNGGAITWGTNYIYNFLLTYQST